MSEPLKKCPFCGGEAKVVGHKNKWVFCVECEAESSICTTVDEAIAEWNRRTNDAETEKIKELVALVEKICEDQRETHGDDSVCGLCEYDGAYQCEGGTWINECPGFERDDCFCLKKSFREKYLGAGETE